MPKMTGPPDRSAFAYRYSRAADIDIEGILRYTDGRFGLAQRRRYAALIDRAASMIAADPMRRGSRPTDNSPPGVRSFHIELAARRRGAAAHVLYYVQERLDNGRDGVIILRVLHERTDPSRHLTETAT